MNILSYIGFKYKGGHFWILAIISWLLQILSYVRVLRICEA